MGVARADVELRGRDLEEFMTFVREHMTSRFGPVRGVEPSQVFELAFDGIQRSHRNKAGLTLSAPQVVRWCRHKTADQADSVETLGADPLVMWDDQA